jgi:hypothetical protein
MNIKQALKRKKKLIEEISKEWEKVSLYNSVRKGSLIPYSPVEALDAWKAKIDELVELKTKLHKANSKVYDKIFKLSELKSQAKFLKSLDCSEGIAQDRWGATAEPFENVAAISIVSRDKMVLSIEEEIEEIQEALDEHNAKVKI